MKSRRTPRPLRLSTHAVTWWRRLASSRARQAYLAGAIVLAFLLVACGGSETQSTDGTGTAADGHSELVADEGHALYAEHCASCHGADGEGEPDWQVRRADGSLPAPPHDATGHTWHHADGLLFRIVRDGCAAYGGDLASCGMPAFGAMLTDHEIRAVIDALRTWWPAREREFQTGVSAGDPFPDTARR